MIQTGEARCRNMPTDGRNLEILGSASHIVSDIGVVYLLLLCRPT